MRWYCRPPQVPWQILLPAVATAALPTCRTLWVGKEVTLPGWVSSPRHCTVPPAQPREQFSRTEPPYGTTASRGSTTSSSPRWPVQRKEETAGFGEWDKHQKLGTCSLFAGVA